MSKQSRALPTEFFDEKTLENNYKFIESLNRHEILKYRHAYRKELNQSTENNELPEHTQRNRRCFLYLTNNVEPSTI